MGVLWPRASSALSSSGQNSYYTSVIGHWMAPPTSLFIIGQMKQQLTKTNEREVSKSQVHPSLIIAILTKMLLRFWTLSQFLIMKISSNFFRMFVALWTWNLAVLKTWSYIVGKCVKKLNIWAANKNFRKSSQSWLLIESVMLCAHQVKALKRRQM